MKSLKDLLLSAMFVVMASVVLVACDSGEGGGDEPEAKTPITNVVENGAATINAAKEIKEEAEEEEWFPEEEVANGSAANK